MRTSIVFILILLFISVLYTYSPDSKVESTRKLKDFITYIEKGKTKKSLEFLYYNKGFKNTIGRKKLDNELTWIRQLENGKTFNSLDWLKELAEYGEWGELKKLAGESHAKKLAKLFGININNIMGLCLKDNWVAFCYADNYGWQILSVNKVFDYSIKISKPDRKKVAYKDIEKREIDSDTSKNNIQKVNIEDKKETNDKPEDKKNTSSEVKKENSDIKPRKLVKIDEPKKIIKKKIIEKKCFVIPSFNFDVMPEEKLKFTITIKNSAGKSININNKIPHGKYQIKVVYPGYSPVNINFKIPTNVEEYKIPIILTAVRRKLIFNFKSDQDKLVRIVPDEVKIGGDSCLSGDFIFPGEYKLSAKKKGYKDIEEKLRIFASPNPFELNQRFAAITKTVKFAFSNAKTTKALTPDIFKINGTKNNSFKIEIKPSQRISIFAKKEGYEDTKENIKIPEGLAEHTFFVKMYPISPARASFHIDYKVMPENLSEKLEIVLKSKSDNKIQKVKETAYILPGEYSLEIKRRGYKTYKQNIVIKKHGNDFHIPLQAKPRKIILYFVASHNNKQVKADKILLNGIMLEENRLIKPGMYKVIIEKDGYDPLMEIMSIRASDKEFILNKKLNILKRAVKFEFLDEENSERLTPEKIILGDRVIDTEKENKFLPGEYSLKVKLKGYKDVFKKIELPVGGSEYRLPVFLQKKEK